VKFEKLWPFLESLPQPERDSLYAAADKDLRLKFETYGLFVSLLCLLSAIGYLVWPTIHHTFTPDRLARGIMALLFLAGIWLGMRGILALSVRLFNRSVMRELRRRGVSGTT
jgi:hypothetical protein